MKILEENEMETNEPKLKPITSKREALEAIDQMISEVSVLCSTPKHANDKELRRYGEMLVELKHGTEKIVEINNNHEDS